MSLRSEYKTVSGMWPNSEASEFVNAGQLLWHVQKKTNAKQDAPVALLIHGTGASCHSWAPLVKSLLQDFQLIVPDLPGHGFTERPVSSQLSLQGMSTLIRSLLDKLGYSPDLVIGHSAGAAIGANMCLKGMLSPKALISIGGAFMPIGGSKNGLFELAAKLLSGNPLVSRVFAWRARNPAIVQDLMGRTGSEIDDQSYACYSWLARNPRHVSSALGMMANWNLRALIRQLPSLEVPLLILNGGKDKMIPRSDGNKLHQLVKGSKFEIAHDCGHLLHEEDPAWAAIRIINFFLTVRKLGARLQ